MILPSQQMPALRMQALPLSLMQPPSARSSMQAPSQQSSSSQPQCPSRQAVAGIWVSPDGYVRLELQTSGRYSEIWGGRKTGFSGTYAVRDGRLIFVDADGADLIGRITGNILRIDRYEFHRKA